MSYDHDNNGFVHRSRLKKTWYIATISRTPENGRGLTPKGGVAKIPHFITCLSIKNL